ncbi:hypothetical protein O6H91_18G008200 [Diphasiastrum complanatum]|uniref:Uncharacterized protein n=1 Tax=Diphasiastrum complanatum TaxID=34168 RepID=A0ACC2AY25_DIPCM|nr:hypothetical protein O6H91_18G008200 [Diphasiastrum complanatum]
MAAFAAAALSAHYSPLLLLSSPMRSMSLPFPSAIACGLPTNPKPSSLLCCYFSGGGGESAANAKFFMSREGAAKVAMPILAAAIVGLPVTPKIKDEILFSCCEGKEGMLFPFQRVQKLKAAAEIARREWENAAAQKTYFEQIDKEMKAKASPQAPAKSLSLQAEASGPSTVVKSETHGFLPLFVSQFLLLLATIGGGGAIFVLSDSYWKDVQKKLDDNLEKASPIVEETYKQLQPLAIQAWEKAQELGMQAKPYVLQALKTSKPVALKAFEASKPVLKEAQSKATNLFQQAQEKAKSFNQK